MEKKNNIGQKQIYIKLEFGEGIKAKWNPVFFLFLIGLKSNWLSNNSNNVLRDCDMWISEMNDSNVARGMREDWDWSVIK